MAQVVGSHGVAVFTSPNNGDTLDATVVKGNDNNMRSAYVDHDSDAGLHVQSSALVSRPAAGSIGRKWLTADTSSYRLFFDDGSSWYELSYLSSNGGTITGNLDVTGTITGAVTGNASTATALQTARNINGEAFDGTANITVTAAAGTVTGATLASNVVSSSLTSVGTLSTLTVSGAITASGGTANSVAYLNASKVLSTSANLTYDGTTLAIYNGTADNQRLNISTSGTNVALNATRTSGTVPQMLFQIDATERMRIEGNGNLAVDTNTLFVDATNNRVGVGTVSPGAAFDISGADGVRARVVASSAGTSGLVLSSAGATAYTIKAGNADSSLRIDQDGTDRIVLSSGGNLAVTNAVDVGSLTVQTTAAVSRKDYGYGVPYKAITVGGTTTASNVALCVDVSAIAGSAFSGSNQVFVPANGLLTPNAAGTNFIGVLSRDASNRIIIGPSITSGISSGPLFIDNNNLGLGVTPSAWSTYKAFDIAGGGAFIAANNAAEMWSNAFFDGAVKYKANGFATRYHSNSSGSHAWYTAPSGTAGNAISFTQAMTLDASGNLGIGTASPTLYSGFQTLAINSATNGGLLEIQKAGAVMGYLNGNSGMTLLANSGQQLNLTTAGPQSISFNTNAVNRWVIGSTGNILAFADATYDIGASGVSRPRDYYGSGNSILGGYVRVSAASAGVASTTTIGSTTATTVGATGAAAALPANPLGYIIAHVGTTQVKIPYYTA